MSQNTPESRATALQAAAEAATSLARSVGQQPVLATFLLVNLLLIGSVYLSIRESRVREHELVRFVIEHCLAKPPAS